ncbi:hypothetical protein HP572_07460 [Pectobacterium sp. PL64]|uniref:hypothetical protein n=1 Tax=Pectobacterium sp. PL64 TaxID=2738983 RepID=UPI001F0C9767|nr:hypothetical protein [Pectobacterium sp. PL64]UMO89351.1 hypothetical protein HP572_07460 [Pectobacterium sp. PL64]
MSTGPRFARVSVRDSEDYRPLKLSAKTDREAMAELDRFVVDGEKNEAWAVTILDDGRTYMTKNHNGQAVCRFDSSMEFTPAQPAQ